MSYCAYVLINHKGRKYTGSSSDLKSRIEMHNDESIEKAKFYRTTYKKGPWNLIFKKKFKSRIEALRFERFLKTGKGREWLESNRSPRRLN